MGMVVLVIFLFLGNLRATFIPAITVPVALVAAVTVLYALDFNQFADAVGHGSSHRPGCG